MPNTKAAKKFMRVTAKKTALNRTKKKAFRDAVKKVLDLVKAEKFDEAKKAFVVAQKTLDKAAKKGVIKKNAAARKKSRLSKKLKASSKKNK
ncbi:MAG TPA: 30S ribosomal protein S20 [Candidatus Moranbacteria bacterium]|nr:30S ribosomal protein S20 [Candidatus Moranbacteria bacterium]